MLAKELQIYKDCIELADVILNIQQHLPRLLRYTIGQRMIDASLNMMHSIILANRRISERAKHCEEVAEGVEELGVCLRLITKRKCVSNKHQARIVELLVKVGRQANGWKNSAKSGMCAENSGNALRTG